MATLIPVTQPTNVEAAYEDMFKEITRKLYGEETGNGLHTLGTPVAHVVSSGPTAPEGEERSFTTLMSDRHLAPTIQYEQHPEQSTATNNNNNNFKTDEHLTTAFGLAALMQNGFQTAAAAAAGTILPKPSTSNATITSANNQSAGNQNNGNGSTGNEQQQRWNNSNEEILSWPTENKITNFSTTTKPNKSTNNSRKNKNPSNNTQNSNNNNNNNQQQQPPQQKRYTCTHCPYSTDRRDLYTRHENIHKDEKPFQCYACLKQFNRADHVKKHFLRMHRELTYDINKTRRNVNSDQKPTILFNQQQTNTNQQQQIVENFLNNTNNQRTVQQQQEATSLSIAQTIESVATAQVNSPINNNNNNHHQQQQQQLPIQLKQEKISPDEKSPSAIAAAITTTATAAGTNKIKREKRFTCCYCPWSGADKWGLKRHLNTHTKPFVCMLCDYKAARSERLATHVLKVHNKKACNKCSFLADTQEEYQIHMNEVHPHDNRPSRNTNSNVLRTIGNTISTNNQINNFPTANTSFGIQTTNNGVTTTIYANNDNITNNNNNNNNTNNTNNGNLQDIIVNPTSMVGWRLSASGSLIPPSNLHESGGGSSNGNPNQKRGAERLFQYLEADGSDPEDYARLLKMDAISRNTACVAQDFHNAGGGVYNNNNNLNLTTAKPSREAAQLSHQQNNNQENNNIVSDHRKTSINKTIQYNSNNNNYQNDNTGDLRKAMSSFLIDQQLNNKSPPAYLMNQLTKQQNHIETTSTIQNTKGHRINNDFNKENTNLLLSNINNQNMTKLNQQFQNYIKDIINKYYAETPLLHSNLNSNMLSAKTETENYIEYLKSKDDITLIVTSQKKQTKIMSPYMEKEEIIPSVTCEKRNRKQAQPKKVLSHGPEVSIAILRDKYLKKLVVDRKRSCITCTNNKTIKSHMLVFPYHTLGSLVLHRLWKHTEKPKICQKCNKKFIKSYSLKLHLRTKHKTR